MYCVVQYSSSLCCLSVSVCTTLVFVIPRSLPNNGAVAKRILACKRYGICARRVDTPRRIKCLNLTRARSFLFTRVNFPLVLSGLVESIRHKVPVNNSPLYFTLLIPFEILDRYCRIPIFDSPQSFILNWN